MRQCRLPDNTLLLSWLSDLPIIFCRFSTIFCLFLPPFASYYSGVFYKSQHVFLCFSHHLSHIICFFSYTDSEKSVVWSTPLISASGKHGIRQARTIAASSTHKRPLRGYGAPVLKRLPTNRAAPAACVLGELHEKKERIIRRTIRVLLMIPYPAEENASLQDVKCFKKSSRCVHWQGKSAIRQTAPGPSPGCRCS